MCFFLWVMSPFDLGDNGFHKFLCFIALSNKPFDFLSFLFVPVLRFIPTNPLRRLPIVSLTYLAFSIPCLTLSWCRFPSLSLSHWNGHFFVIIRFILTCSVNCSDTIFYHFQFSSSSVRPSLKYWWLDILWQFSTLFFVFADHDIYRRDWI